MVLFWGDKREVFTKQSVVSQLRRSFMYWRTIALVFRFRNTFLNDRIFISTNVLQRRRIWYYQYLWWFPSIMQIKRYNDTFLNNTHTLDFENYTCNVKLVFNTHTKNEKFFIFLEKLMTWIYCFVLIWMPKASCKWKYSTEIKLILCHHINKNFNVLQKSQIFFLYLSL